MEEGPLDLRIFPRRETSDDDSISTESPQEGINNDLEVENAAPEGANEEPAEIFEFLEDDEYRVVRNMTRHGHRDDDNRDDDSSDDEEGNVNHQEDDDSDDGEIGNIARQNINGRNAIPQDGNVEPADSWNWKVKIIPKGSYLQETPGSTPAKPVTLNLNQHERYFFRFLGEGVACHVYEMMRPEGYEARRDEPQVPGAPPPEVKVAIKIPGGGTPAQITERWHGLFDNFGDNQFTEIVVRQKMYQQDLEQELEYTKMFFSEHHKLINQLQSALDRMRNKDIKFVYKRVDY